jgi:hypothetical protein
MYSAPPPESAGLNDVSAVDARTIFAVGATGYPGKPFAGRWNGTRWQEITSGLPSSTTGMELTLVGAVSACETTTHLTTGSDQEVGSRAGAASSAGRGHSRTGERPGDDAVPRGTGRGAVV